MGKTETAQAVTNHAKANLTNMAGRTLKKVSARQIKFSDQEEGYEFSGTFIGITEKPFADVDKKSGEIIEKTLYNLIVEDDKGERFTGLADAGLRGALSDAMITKGDWFKAVKGSKIDIGKGRSMNQWDIYTYADN